MTDTCECGADYNPDQMPFLCEHGRSLCEEHRWECRHCCGEAREESA